MAECGTNNGYERHRRANQKACLPCSAAHSRHSQAWKVQSGHSKQIRVDVDVLTAVLTGDIDVLRMALGPEIVAALENRAALIESRRRRDAETLAAATEVVERLDATPDSAFDAAWSAIHDNSAGTYIH